MSKARNLANLLADGAVGASELADTLDLSGKTISLPNGVGGAAIDTEANRPASPAVGTLFFNTTQDTLQQYTSNGWLDVGQSALGFSSVSGAIYNSVATSLQLTGAGFGLSAIVRFSYNSVSTDVNVTPASDTLINVAVPAAVYSQAVSTTITISVIVGARVSNVQTKSVVAAPTGGTITISNNYRIHTFTQSGTFSVPAGVGFSTVEYLVIGGGGGGGGSGGGGGAGGYRSSVQGESSGGGGAAEAPFAVVPGTNYSVVVGLGGTGAGWPSNGQPGQNSEFDSIIALGGGLGAHAGGAGNGGSGGGGAQAFAGGSGTANQGYAGGTGVATPDYPAGGGGGAGGIGASSTNGSRGGDGGIGVQSSIDGVLTYRAGGGGGGVRAGSNSVGGQGGGGNGSSSTNGQAGTANTGGGGGGSGSGGSGPFAGNGGSGIVIIRYQL